MRNSPSISSWARSDRDRGGWPGPKWRHPANRSCWGCRSRVRLPYTQGACPVRGELPRHSPTPGGIWNCPVTEILPAHPRGCRVNMVNVVNVVSGSTR